jgi:anti-anti-sigma factor
MEINAERDGATLIAKTEGRVDGTNATEFQDALRNVITSDDKAVILNFEELSYISSAGLRVILLTAKDMRTANVRFAVCSLSQSVRDVFTISGFDQIIDIHDDQQAALGAVGN